LVASEPFRPPALMQPRVPAPSTNSVWPLDESQAWPGKKRGAPTKVGGLRKTPDFDSGLRNRSAVRDLPESELVFVCPT